MAHVQQLQEDKCMAKELTVADNVDSNETLFDGAASTVELQKKESILVSP
jgi:hypothetical protein